MSPGNQSLFFENTTSTSPTSSTTFDLAGLRQGSPGTPDYRTASMHIESEDQPSNVLQRKKSKKRKPNRQLIKRRR
jgi:hypothetical protein